MVLPLFHHDGAATATAGASLTLTGAEGKHAVAVRRLRVGEGVQVSDGNGCRVIGVVKTVDGNALSFTVSDVLMEKHPSPALVLVQALAKGDRDELAVQAATELGVSRIVPWQADRSVSRWDGPKVAKGVERWQTIVAEAAKQALRAFTPEVSQPLTSNQLVGQVSGFAKFLVLDPTAGVALGRVELPSQGEVAIAVGPEGGISDSELERLAEAGAVRVRLGAEILRTSTAGVAAVAVLQSNLGRW